MHCKGAEWCNFENTLEMLLKEKEQNLTDKINTLHETIRNIWWNYVIYEIVLIFKTLKLLKSPWNVIKRSEIMSLGYFPQAIRVVILKKIKKFQNIFKKSSFKNNSIRNVNVILTDRATP